MSVSEKLELATASSAEAEVVSTGEWFPKCAWFRHARIAQVDAVNDDMLIQDRKSFISLHENCLCSA